MEPKQSTDQKALKSGVWYIFTNFLVKGAVFFSTPVFSRLMTEEEVGLFSNASAWAHILMVITSLELMTSITFSKFEYGEKNLDRFISSVLVLSSSVTTAFYVIVLIFRNFFMAFFEVDFLSLNLIFTYCLFAPALQMIQIKNRVLFQYKSSTILSILSVFLSTAIALLFVAIMKDKLAGRMIGYYGSLIIFNLIIYIFIIYKGKAVDTKYWKFALGISIPLVVHALSTQLLSFCDRIMITKICGSASNAMYSVAYTGSSVISVLWTSLNSAWSPWAYEQMNKEAYSKLKRASRPYILMFFLVVVMFMFIAPEFMLLNGKGYYDATKAIPPIAVGMFFQFLYSIYINIELYHKKQKFTAIGTLIAALLNFVLNWLLIPKFGYIAAAYTTLIGYMTLFAIHFIIVALMHKSWWYDSKFNLIVLGVSLLMIPIMLLIYMNTIIRWSIMGVMLVLLTVYLIKIRKELIVAIKSKSIEQILQLFKI